MNSGGKIYLGNKYNWLFVPYNYQNIALSSQLIKELKKAKFDVDRLKNDDKYTLRKITTPAERKALKHVYARLDGNINENSMLVYSGPEKEIDYSKCFLFLDCSPPKKFVIRPGCIYTGDCNLKKVDLNTVYSNFQLITGAIQVPHHGSKHSFSYKSLNRFSPSALFLISFGTKNNYGHPSADVIEELSQKKIKPLSINEHSDTEVVQYIRLCNRFTL